jgi:hypothetical protein
MTPLRPNHLRFCRESLQNRLISRKLFVFHWLHALETAFVAIGVGKAYTMAYPNLTINRYDDS